MAGRSASPRPRLSRTDYPKPQMAYGWPDRAAPPGWSASEPTLSGAAAASAIRPVRGRSGSRWAAAARRLRRQGVPGEPPRTAHRRRSPGPRRRRTSSESPGRVLQCADRGDRGRARRLRRAARRATAARAGRDEGRCPAASDARSRASRPRARYECAGAVAPTSATAPPPVRAPRDHRRLSASRAGSPAPGTTTGERSRWTSVSRGPIAARCRPGGGAEAAARPSGADYRVRLDLVTIR